MIDVLDDFSFGIEVDDAGALEAPVSATEPCLEAPSQQAGLSARRRVQNAEADVAQLREHVTKHASHGLDAMGLVKGIAKADILGYEFVQPLQRVLRQTLQISTIVLVVGAHHRTSRRVMAR